MTSGNQNVALGKDAATNLTSGDSNIAIGFCPRIISHQGTKPKKKKGFSITNGERDERNREEKKETMGKVKS